jgi:hypothetical protein
LFDFTAHKKAATNVAISPLHQGLFISVSLDGYVKVFDGEKLNDKGTPSLISEKYLKQSTV